MEIPELPRDLRKLQAFPESPMSEIPCDMYLNQENEVKGGFSRNISHQKTKPEKEEEKMSYIFAASLSSLPPPPGTFGVSLFVAESSGSEEDSSF